MQPLPLSPTTHTHVSICEIRTHLRVSAMSEVNWPSFFLGGTFILMHLKIDVIMDEIKYCKKCMALNTTPGRKQIFRKISCNQCPCHHQTGCPSRKEII